MNEFRHIRSAAVIAGLLASLASATTAPVSLSTTFVGTGVTALSTPTNYEAFVGASRTTTGAIVAAGNFGTSVGSDLVVARFTSDGRLDTSFGLGGVAMHDAGARDDSLRAMTALADGRIVAVGQSGGRALVAMFRSDGRLDTGFGSGGYFRIAVVGAARTGLSSVSLKADGGILASGSVLLADGEHVLLLSLDARGALDARFDQDGVRVVRETLGADSRSQLLADGRIVVAARAPGAVLVMRFDAAGGLDPSFGNGGVASAPRLNATPIVALALVPEGYVVAERADARLTLFDVAGQPRAAQALAAGGALAGLARGADGRFVLAFAAAAAQGSTAQLSTVTLQTMSPSTTRPRTAAEVNAARAACQRITARSAKTACLAAATLPITVSGTPIAPTFAVSAKVALPVAGAEVLALQLAANGAVLIAGYAIDGGDTDFLLNVAQLAAP